MSCQGGPESSWLPVSQWLMVNHRNASPIPGSRAVLRTLQLQDVSNCTRRHQSQQTATAHCGLVPPPNRVGKHNPPRGVGLCQALLLWLFASSFGCSPDPSGRGVFHIPPVGWQTL